MKRKQYCRTFFNARRRRARKVSLQSHNKKKLKYRKNDAKSVESQNDYKWQTMLWMDDDYLAGDTKSMAIVRNGQHIYCWHNSLLCLLFHIPLFLLFSPFDALKIDAFWMTDKADKVFFLTLWCIAPWKRKKYEMSKRTQDAQNTCVFWSPINNECAKKSFDFF